jgi:hypothetical protein
MKLKDTLTIGVLSLALLADHDSRNSFLEDIPNNTPTFVSSNDHIRGIPLSVKATGSPIGSALAVVINVDGPDNPYNFKGPHNVLCTTGIIPGSIDKVTEMSALIQAEIDDGDNEYVHFSGYRSGYNKFIVNSAGIPGYTQTFWRKDLNR